MNPRVLEITGGILLAVVVLVGLPVLFSEASDGGAPALLLVLLIYGLGGYALIRLIMTFWRWVRERL